MVVDPPDGRVPVMKWAEDRRDYDLAHLEDHYVHETPWVRCITRGVPGGMFPAGYNNGYEIIQIPGYVIIAYEMIHDTRIIPLDGRPHVGANIRLWNGDARGRWEGNTLVVETTNFNDKGVIGTSAATGRIRGIPHSEELHVVERFTRISEDVINYSATITDPEGVHGAVDRGAAAEPRPELPDVRVRLPRRQSRAAERLERRPRARARRLLRSPRLHEQAIASLADSDICSVRLCAVCVVEQPVAPSRESVSGDSTRRFGYGRALYSNRWLSKH